MSYTVTLTKKPGSTEANVFLGNRAGAGAALSDWQILQRYDEIKHHAIIFNVVESTDPRLFQPSLNIRYGEDYAGSSTYPPRASLKAAGVKAWILEFIRNNQEKLSQPQVEEEVEDEEPVKPVAVAKKSTSRAKSNSNAPAEVEEKAAVQDAAAAPLEPAVSGTPSWLKPTIFGGTVVAAVLAGVGIALSTGPDDEEEFDDHTLFFESEDGKPITNWNQQRHQKQ